MNQLTLIKTVSSRRRKLKIRRLKYTLQARNGTVAAAYGGGDVERGVAHVTASYGAVSVIGRRKEMEDAVRAELGFAKINRGGQNGNLVGWYDFFGVYDGHGGARVAEACKRKMHQLVANEMTKISSSSKNNNNNNKVVGCGYWEEVMESGFERMDEEVREEKNVGSTAVVVVVGPEEVVVANCGDCRAVLSRAGVAVPLSVDHKPDRPDECERIEAAGGKVINWNGHRIFGVIATSRSLGDEYLKPFVISKPEVTVTKRSELDEFLILASDGLWDVLSNEEACQVARRCLNGRMKRKSQEVMTQNGAAEAAAVLTELSMARGSGDNISVIVVDLRKPVNFS